MKTLIVATKNKGKLEEIRSLLKDLPFKIKSLSDYKNLPEIIEDGKTFRANALKKALTISRHTGQLVLGEDSGIQVKVLGNRPGVRSARYSGREATDQQNNEKLLKELRGVPMKERKARYRCVAALTEGERVIAVVSGSCEGLIAGKPEGTNGFGYDPLFFIPKYNKTFGLLPPPVKASMSHRAKAMEKVRDVLVNYRQGM
ncbi:MAG: XTP/dITP diphosphatase [Candidatus Omnitrophota bacterium]